MKPALSQFLDIMVAQDDLHCLWLNTLSMMENIGATKIVKSEHPFMVTETILKHAAEETRHAYYLKRQINKIKAGACPNYAPEYLVNPRQSYQYLHLLDSRICKALAAHLGLKDDELRRHAYVLVTYAVEVRADDLYRLYQASLKAHNSPVSVRGILAEEEQHLAEMETEIDLLFQDANFWRQKTREIETALYDRWLGGLAGFLAQRANAA